MEIKESLTSGGELVVKGHCWYIEYYFQGPDLRYKGKWIQINGSQIDLYMAAWKYCFQRYVELKSVVGDKKFNEHTHRLYISECGVSLVDDFYRLPFNGQPINCQEQLNRLIKDYEYCKKQGLRLQIKVEAINKGFHVPSEAEIDEKIRLIEEDRNAKSFDDRYKVNKRNDLSIIAFCKTIKETMPRFVSVVKHIGFVVAFIMGFSYILIGCEIAWHRATPMYHRNPIPDLNIGYLADFFIYIPFCVWIIVEIVKMLWSNYCNFKCYKGTIMFFSWLMFNALILFFAAFSDSHTIKYIDMDVKYNALQLWCPFSFGKFENPLEVFKVYDLTEFSVYVVVPFIINCIYLKKFHPNKHC